MGCGERHRVPEKKVEKIVGRLGGMNRRKKNKIQFKSSLGGREKSILKSGGERGFI